MSLNERQPMLHRAVILLPYELDWKAFHEVSAAIDYINTEYGEEADQISLRVHGPGGYLSSSFALIDLIRLESQEGLPIHGYLYGDADSAHGMVWAACPKRFVMPSGRLGIHGSQSHAQEGYTGLDVIKRQLQLTLEGNRKMAEVYASASPEHDVDYWLKLMEDNPGDLYRLDADALVDQYKMAERVSIQKE